MQETHTIVPCMCMCMYMYIYNTYMCVHIISSYKYIFGGYTHALLDPMCTGLWWEGLNSQFLLQALKDECLDLKKQNIQCVLISCQVFIHAPTV